MSNNKDAAKKDEKKADAPAQEETKQQEEADILEDDEFEEFEDESLYFAKQIIVPCAHGRFKSTNPLYLFANN